MFQKWAQYQLQNDMIILCSLLLALTVAWFVLQPHIEKSPAFMEQDEELNLISLQDVRDRLVQSLKDLELDRATGKVSEADFSEGKNSLSVELAGILKKIDNRKKHG